MARETILYLFDQAHSTNSILGALQATGYEVVSTHISTEAVALLFVMRSAAVVVLDQRAREQSSFDVGRSLRAIRPDVPIVLLCREQVDRLPSWVDACVSTGAPLNNLTSAVRRLLTAKPAIRGHLRFGFLRRAS